MTISQNNRKQYKTFHINNVSIQKCMVIKINATNPWVTYTDTAIYFISGNLQLVSQSFNLLDILYC